MAERQLSFKVVFDADTGDMKDVQKVVDGVEQSLGKKLPAAGEKAGEAFKRVAEVAKGVALGSLMERTAMKALEASDALDDLKTEFDATAAVIIQTFEPALKFISDGLQGLLIIIQRSFQTFRKIAAGDFAGAWEDIQLAILEGGERARGATQQVSDDIVQTVRNQLKAQLADTTLRGEERLAEINRIEQKVLELTRQSAEFQQLRQELKERRLSEIQLEFAEMRRRAHLQEVGEADALRASQEAEEDAAIQRRDEKERAAAEGRLAMIDEFVAAELAKLGETEEEKIATLQVAAEAKTQIVNDLEQNLTITEEQANAKRLAIARNTAAAVGKIKVDEAKAVLKASADKAKMVLAIESAVADRLIQLSYEAGLKGGMNARDFAREIVKTVAQAASAQIMAHYSTAAALEVSTKGLAGLGTASIMMAKGAALASAVAALGGAAARSIGGEGGGGGAPAPAGGPGSGLPSSGGGGTPQEVLTGERTMVQTALGPMQMPAASGGPGRVTNVYVNTLGTIPPEVNRLLEAERDERENGGV